MKIGKSQIGTSLPAIPVGSVTGQECYSVPPQSATSQHLEDQSSYEQTMVLNPFPCREGIPSQKELEVFLQQHGRAEQLPWSQVKRENYFEACNSVFVGAMDCFRKGGDPEVHDSFYDDALKTVLNEMPSFQFHLPSNRATAAFKKIDEQMLKETINRADQEKEWARLRELNPPTVDPNPTLFGSNFLQAMGIGDKKE